MVYKHVLPTMVVYAVRDEKGAKTGKMTTQFLSELQYKYTFMHTMKASFPIVSVTTFLQCSLVYMGKYSFSQMNNNYDNNKKCLLANAVGLGHVLNVELDSLLTHSSA